jgi:6-phosphogluconolactonase
MSAVGPLVVAEARALAREAAGWIARALQGAVAARGTASLGLAGGRTPAPVYAALAGPPHRDAVDWSRVEIFFGDERAVGPDDPESNFRLASDTLLRHVAIPAARVHRMEADRADLEVAADAYAALLPPALDVLVLGMGPDGHTASLFPGSAALLERRRLVVPVVGPKPPPRRLTITPPVIAAARAIAVLVTGADKAAMVARARDAGTEVREVPARLALGGTWFLDPAAAGRLAAAEARR